MISVIIPCYNSEHTVARAIESVISQTYDNWEIILVNNRSTDKTLEVLVSYCNKFPGSIKIFEEHKPGSAFARNHGLLEAKGEWIQYLDADDELLPDKLQAQVKLAEDAKCDIVASSFVKHVQQGSKILEFKHILKSQDKWHALFYSELGITSANLWKTECLRKVAGWNESLSSSQEYDLLFRMLKSRCNVFIDRDIRVIIHTPENSISRSASNIEKRKEVISNWLNLRLEMISYMESTGKMNSGLRSHFDNHIYSKYTLYKGFVPAKYINQLLSPLQLNVSLSNRIKANSKYFLSRLRKIKRGLKK